MRLPLDRCIVPALVVILGFGPLSGCAVQSVKGWADGVVREGGTITDMKNNPYRCRDPDIECPQWTAPDYYRANGNAVYRQMTNPHCWYHWEVDRDGRIIGWRVESESGTWWARNACDFLPPPGEKFSRWFGGNE